MTYRRTYVAPLASNSRLLPPFTPRRHHTMKRLCWLALAALLVPFAAARDDAKKEKEDGFVPLFNGKNLDGWVRVNNAPRTFYVKDNEIITTGKPTGIMRTAKQYEN